MPVATVTVPEKLGRKALSQLHRELDAILADPAVRVIVLRGRADCFCSGMDLGEITQDAVPLPDAPKLEMAGAEDALTQGGMESGSLWERGTRDFTAVLQTLLDAPPITLAVVDGPALGGGTGLVAACDWVIATEQATFALPELLLGLVPAIILPVLAERLGLHQAKRWAITQATWQAGEAHTRGLVDQVVPFDKLEVTLKRMLRTLLRVHPRGVTTLKRYVRSLSSKRSSNETSMDVSTAMLEGQQLLLQLLGEPEVRADIIGFRDFGILPGQVD